MRTFKDLLALFFSLAIGLAFIIGGIYLAFAEDSTFFGAFLMVLGIFPMMMFKAGLGEFEERAPENVKKNFYEKCCENGINDLTTEKDLQKAILIAEQLSIKNTKNIKKIYQQGKELYKADKAAEYAAVNRQKLREKKEAEKVIFDERTKYAEFKGREKRAAILKDKADALFGEAYRLEKGMDLLMRSSQQKEIDWATHGGIAAGLAGGGAGAAVAIDAQIRNMEIRAKNDEAMKSLIPASMLIKGSASDMRKKAGDIILLKNAAEIKLIGNIPAEDLMQYFVFNNKKVTISETGAFEISVNAKLKRDVTIFDDVSAVIDGTIAADLYQDNKKVGTALMVLPTFGIGEACTLEGICLSGASKDKPYELKLRPYHLWAMEE